MIEKYLIEHCAPTLASLKIANLFNLTFTTEAEFQHQLGLWNSQLNEKDVFLCVLRRNRNSALVYVYRQTLLKKRLTDPQIAMFLHCYGYREEIEVKNALQRLKMHFAKCEQFPHEIGVFLGYPLEDVKGFIKNSGRNCKCTGCWKVYCNECDAVKTFEKYKKCKAIYLGLWNSGKSVNQLTVAV